MFTNYSNFTRLCLTVGFSGVAFVVMQACASHHHDDSILNPEEPDIPEAPLKFGLDRQEVLNYFSAALNGAEEAFASSGPLTSDQVKEASDYIWDMWAASVQRASGEKLPALSSHYRLDRWDLLEDPDAIWTVPEGKMNIFYGSKGEQPADGYPLFLYLHGSGSNADEEWRAGIYHTQMFDDGPSAYFEPKSPQGGTGTRWFQPSKQAKWEQMLRQALVSDKINPKKIYFIGISEGAYGSQRLASFYADYLAGAGPIAGGELLTPCPPENLANIAFSLQTGERDRDYGRNLLTDKVNTLLNELEGTHPGYYVHNVELQPNKGHGCDYYKTTPWLINYSRNATPKYVYWENYGLGDINGEPRRYRDSFYNLCILEPSDDRSDDMSRTAYEMTITGNEVNITVNNVKLATNEPSRIPTGSINIGVEKTKTPATSGKLRVYLSDALVDLSQPVTIKINGKDKYNGVVETTTGNIIESIRTYYDPLRIFPASVDVTVN